MTEHLHEFALLTDLLRNHPMHDARCVHCSLEIRRDEIERRLNATERLSAEDAREIAADIHGDWWPLEGESPYEDGLRAYAAALEEG